MYNNPQVLYRFYGAKNELLYIGITGDFPSRLNQHSKDKPWWVEVQTITLEHFHSRRVVESAELDAIGRERPRYNVIGNGRMVPAAGAGWVASALKAKATIAAQKRQMDRFTT